MLRTTLPLKSKTLMWQMKDYKERNSFILKLPFRNVLFSCKLSLKNAPQKLNFEMAKTV